jgi:hypothetical protein
MVRCIVESKISRPETAVGARTKGQGTNINGASEFGSLV